MSVAVIGGGVTGLAAAYRLRSLLGEDAELTVLEASGRLGGDLQTAELAGRALDVGAEAFLWRRPELTGLAREIGLEGELVHPTPAGPRLRAGGRVVPLPPRTFMGVPAAADGLEQVLSPAGVARVAAEPGLPPLRLDGDVSIGELLRERMGDEVVDRLVDPLLGGVYAGRADRLGLRATMPALAAAFDAGAGSVSAAVARLLPPPAPDGARPPVFGAFRGGMRSLVERLCELAAAEIVLGAPVRAVCPDGDGWRIDVDWAAGPIHAGGVVLAVPAPVAGRLLAGVSGEAADALAGIPLASMAIVALALPPGTELPAWSGVLIAAGERRAGGAPLAAKAFTFSSRKWAHLGDGVLVRGSVGRFGEEADLDRSDEELVAEVRADLAELTGVEAAPLDASVRRFPGALPQYEAGHLERVAAVERAVAGLPGLAVAGAALRGVGLPACVETAFAAAGRVAESLRVKGVDHV